MLQPHLLRRLTLDPRAHPRGQPHLSSASGLVRAGSHLYIAADDEHHLARLDAEHPSSPLALIRLAPGIPPEDAAERKKRKPDVEVLLHLPGSMTGGPGVLLLLGSGSRPQRERAFAFQLQEDGAMAGAAREISLSALYAPLRNSFGELNLEAAHADGHHVHLFQRAHRGQALNGRITYEARQLCRWIKDPDSMPPQALSIERFSLGDCDGVPFGITDAAAAPGAGLVFTAVAEDTDDAYRDGACLASIVGWIDAGGQVRARERLAGAPKVEGITAAGEGRFWLVTDADDPGRASELLELAWRP